MAEKSLKTSLISACGPVYKRLKTAFLIKPPKSFLSAEFLSFMNIAARKSCNQGLHNALYVFMLINGGLARALPFLLFLAHFFGIVRWITLIWGAYQQRTIMDIAVKSLHEFIAALNSVKKKNAAGESRETIFYRGQANFSCGQAKANKGWDVVPGIFRKDDKSEEFIFSAEAERDILEEFCSYFYDEFRDKTAFEKLLAAQHYELPTRLIDVTLNPLVALYFACKGEYNKGGEISCYATPEANILSPDSDRLRILSNIAFLRTRDKKNIEDLAAEWNPKKTQWNDAFVKELESRFLANEADKRDRNEADKESYSSYLRLMHFLECETGHFGNKIWVNDLHECFFVNPVYSNPRIKAQSGGFIISAFEQNYKKLEEEKGSLFCKIKIPESDDGKIKKDILEELDALNINEETLFPEKAHVAAYLKNKYKRKS